jgi:O-antigen ligase
VLDRGQLYKPVRKKRALIWILAVLCAAAAAFILLPFRVLRMALGMLLLIPFVIIIIDRPKLSLYLMLFTLFSSIYLVVSFPVIKILVLLTMVSMTVMIFRRWQPFIHDRFFFFLVFIFLVAVIQSIIPVRDTSSYFYRLDNLIKNIIIVMLATQFVRNRSEFRMLMAVIIIAFAAMNYLPIILPAAVGATGRSESILVEQAVSRYAGYVRDPNTFGVYQFFIMPVLLFFVSIRRTGRLLKTAAILLFLGSIAIIIITFSRGAFLTLISMLFLLLIIERRNRAILYSGLILIAAAVLIAPVVYWDRISSIFRISSYMNEDYAIMSRLTTMKVALILGIRNPVFGVGLDNFLYHAARYTSYGNVVHNSLLQVFAETGFPGLLIMVTAIIYNFRLIALLARDRADSEKCRLGRFLFVQQASFLFGSMTLPLAYDNVFWFILIVPSIAYHAYCSSAKAGLSGKPAPQSNRL